MKNQIYSYVVMGVLAMILNLVMYSFFIIFMPMEPANVLSFSISLVFAYLTNKVYVFHSLDFSKGTIVREGVSFIAARSVTGILEIVMQPQLYAMGITGSLFEVEGLQAKLIICLLLSILNYLFTKLWVFRPVTLF